MLIRPLLLALLLASPAMADDVTHLSLVPTGAQHRLGGSIYLPLPLSKERPASVRKVPADLSADAMYGSIKMPGATPTPFTVVFDAPPGRVPRLLVDANGDGDLTDDAAVPWTPGNQLPADDGVPGLPNSAVGGRGTFTLHLGTPGHPRDVGLGVWRYSDKVLAKRAASTQPTTAPSAKPPALMYYRDYFATGPVTVDGHAHTATLVDELATGSFTPAAGKLVRLFIDLNDNGKVDAGEGFDAARPFKIAGQAYELTDVAADGSSFRLAKTDKFAPSPDDVKVGQVAPAFTAVDSAGVPIAFPGDYKGKLVLLDFWATWCAPCMAEVPTVVAVYDKHRGDGFTIVGVSRDQPGDEAKVKTVADAHHMAWRQLVTAAGKSDDVTDLYSVTGIPSAFLIDGTTGKILAVGDDLRGPGLEREVAKAVANRAHSGL